MVDLMQTSLSDRARRRKTSAARARRLILERFESRDFFDGAGAAVIDAPLLDPPADIVVYQPSFSFNAASNGNLIFVFGPSLSADGLAPLPPLSLGANGESYDSALSLDALADTANFATETVTVDWFARQNSALSFTQGAEANFDSSSLEPTGPYAWSAGDTQPGVPQITSASAGIGSVVEGLNLGSLNIASGNFNASGTIARHSEQSKEADATEKPRATESEVRRASILTIPAEPRTAAARSGAIDVAVLARETPPTPRHTVLASAVHNETQVVRSIEPQRGIVRAMEIAHSAHLRRRAELANAAPSITPAATHTGPKLQSREMPKFEPVSVTSPQTRSTIASERQPSPAHTSDDSHAAVSTHLPVSPETVSPGPELTLVDRAAHAWRWFVERGLAAAIDLGRRLPHGTFAAAVVSLALVAAAPQKSPAKEEVDRDPKRFGSGRNENE